MKKTTWMLQFIFIIFLAATQLSFAQKKLGHINSELLISLMPESQKVKTQLEELTKTYEDEFKNIGREYETKAKKYQAEAASKSDAINQTRAKELQDMEKRLQEYRQNAAKDLQTKRIELLKPILDKAQKAIDKVAKKKGLEYVFDASKGQLLYAKDSRDIISEVKKELGIKSKK